MIHIVNKYTHEPTDQDIYIGRDSELGNPYTGSKELGKTKAEFQCASREEAIEKYEAWLKSKVVNKDRKVLRQLEIIHTLSEAGEVNLVCFCDPKPCHGHVVKKVIEELFVGSDI